MNMNTNCSGGGGPLVPVGMMPGSGLGCQSGPQNVMNNDNCNTMMKNQQINFSIPSPRNNMSCLPMNGGNISPFDVDCKMNNFPNEYNPNISDRCSSSHSSPLPPPSMPNSCGPPPRMFNCGMNMSMPPSNMIPSSAGQNKMSNSNILPNNLTSQSPSSSMKTSAIDGQFMQQHQNQVFVFSTMLANHAAEAVDQGHFPSIIHFHMNHPQTKKFIDKNSIKLQNFNRPSNVWMGSNIRQPRIRGPNANGMPIRSNFNNPCFSSYNPPGPGPGGGSPGAGPWNHNQWHGNNHISNNNFPPNDIKMNCGNNGGVRMCGPGSQQYNFNHQSYPIGCNESALQDDNLTPQQKQHRENKLAILANLQQKFLQQELMESNNRLPPQINTQSSQPNDFVSIDQMSSAANPNQDENKNENDPLNQPPLPLASMNPSEMNFSSNFCPNSMMGNHSNSDQWMKSSGPNFPIEETKPFVNGRRKGSQSTNHQSPISQTSVTNSPNSCINQSPGNRVPPPSYNQGLRSMSSPHPGSPASLSLPSPRMPVSNDSRQAPYNPGSVRSGPSTPSADTGCSGPPLINSPKSGRGASTNPSPSNKKNKHQQQQQQQASIENDLSLFAKSEHPLMPVPSPQQIDYINTFEGQELTIQKQPNAHFQETNDMIGNSDLSGLNNDLFPNDFCSNNSLPMDLNPNNSRFPMNSQACGFESRFPNNNGGNMRFSGQTGGPQASMMDGYRPPRMCGPPNFNQNEPNNMRFPNCDIKNRMSTPGDLGAFPSSNSLCDFNNAIPSINEPPFSNGPNLNECSENPNGSTHLQNLQKMALPFDVSSNSKMLGPNLMGPNSVKGPRMQSNFDPGSFVPGPMGNMPACNDINDANFGPSPAPQSNMNYSNSFSPSPQMPSNMLNANSDSQFGGGGSSGMHPGGSFSPMPMNAPSHPIIDQPSSNGPNSMSMMPSGYQNNFPSRLPMNSTRPPMNAPNTHNSRYNSPNIQVKPDAPNTIQYLPSRPQGPTTTPPTRPPNLDFLHQSLNMGSNKQSGPSQPPPSNNYYPPNNGPPMPLRGSQNMNFSRGPMMRPHMQNMNNSMPPGGGMCSGPGGNDMFNRPLGNHQMNSGPNQMPPPPSNASFGNGPPPPGLSSINDPVQAAPNKPGNNGSVMHLDSFNFNKSSFNSLPSTSDPNYAAQFHNFQQQLYATNTRNSANPRMSSNF
ncbi:hypothetical protein QR98_0006440 [Sarcoptes scabiei]|uniref:BCL9-like protein n=1 Tax=Sarcoptes scabiei TaxID=52283 RepID=A0A131ZVC9_SARSC|nr:hypothetical protein QR98_0006440 [Sarcoptes scabiei]